MVVEPIGGWMHGWIGKSVRFPEVWVAFIYSWSECGEGSQWQIHRFKDHLPSLTSHQLTSSIIGFLCDRLPEPVVVPNIALYLVLTWGPSMNYPFHGILQTKTLEWIAFPFSRGFSQPRD